MKGKDKFVFGDLDDDLFADNSFDDNMNEVMTLRNYFDIGMRWKRPDPIFK